MFTYTRSDALRLLRVINMTQAHGRVGKTVMPVEAAQAAWLEPGSHRYEEALWYLLWQGALEADEGALEVPVDRPFGYSPYRLTATAIRMLGIG